MAEIATLEDYLNLLNAPRIEYANAAPKQESGMKLRIIYAVDDAATVISQYANHGFELHCPKIDACRFAP